MKKTNIIAGVLLILGLAFGFFGGIEYQRSTKESGQLSQGSGGAGRRFAPGQGNNRPVTGEIISVDGKSITVKLPDGSSKIILVSDKIQINKAKPALKTDLKTGEKVAVFGTTNSDGSVTAMNIQLNPQMRGGYAGSSSASARN